ncbi:MAG: 50S ribosomal protein L30 [Rikenellaceae bacterium]|jgi:large subunit ribosomal protein L30|nr:50S ribosomal protein L30 [Rikenellaceae bacterium]MBO7213372.1 50S ribosomal protein L30 [Rikenellaceae bacterium]MBR4999306.1 50S ribosomal protein L30 [Rikenellaceae bacterium]MBR6496130.1 50S ribosomal protein L30 [Rikenellaceae bacterium]
MAKIRITKVRSSIGASENQKKNLLALGLRKINQTVEHEASPIIMGMVTKVNHLVKVEEVK